MPETYPRKLKRVVIREEYVALTGNYIRAILLHQLEYRQKCAFDVDRYVAEEGERLAQDGVEANVLPANGWFYKKAAELAEETMLDLDETTIRRHVKYFIQRGWVNERRNPRKKWDRTMQYRLNLVRIKSELETIGYQLEKWVFKNQVSPMDSTSGKLQLGSCDLQDGSGNMQDGSGKLPLGSCNLQEQYQNTSSQHLKEHTHHTGGMCECVSYKNAGTRTETTSKRTHETTLALARHAPRTSSTASMYGRSEFSLEVCLEFAEYLHQTGKGITNPGGYAVAIHRSGAADAMIKKYREQTAKCHSSNDPSHGEPSLMPEQVAEHASLIGELLEGGYTHEQIEAQFAASYHPEVWALIKEATVSVFTSRKQEQA